jgi:BlaI family transcriptional regulator, penicillinase repressor
MTFLISELRHMSTSPETALPTDRELEALKALWNQGSLTVREIQEHIRQEGAELAYTTVLSLLQVMEQKGLVTHEAEGKTYRYAAVADRNATLTELAQRFVDRVFDGAVDEYLLFGLASRGLTPAEWRRLEDVLNQARRRRGPNRGGSTSR